VTLRHRLQALGALGLVALTMGLGSASGHSGVPLPTLARIVPRGYHAAALFRADLTADPVPDIVLTSQNDPDALFPHSDIQVLSWDAKNKRWHLVFDAQKTKARLSSMSPRQSNRGAGYAETVTPMTTLLTYNAYIGQTINKVQFAPLLPANGNQLEFSVAYLSLSAQGSLVVVDLHSAKPKVLYTWTGAGLTSWSIADRKIHATGDYFVTYDAQCCPARTYAFEVGARGNHITEVSDDRPFLGVIVQPTPTGQLRVVKVDPGTPAAGHLRAGDVLLNIAGSKTHVGTLFDRIASLHAGQTAELLVRRGKSRVTERVRLASMDTAAAATITTPPVRATTSYPNVAL
jgi:hypothetical protein